MKSVRINKDKLLGTVKENREVHIADYNEAMEGYREELEERLVDKLESLRAGELPSQNFRDLPIPQVHTDEYDQAISMLEFSVDDTIELEHREFRQYVLDQWDWKAIFAASTANYSKGKFS